MLLGDPPIHAENLHRWKRVTESYRDLSLDDQGKIRTWLHCISYPYHKHPKEVTSRTNHIWSLSQSIREPSKIWWKRSLFEATVGHQRQLIDLVDLGDVLGFSYRNEKFEINEENLHNVANRLAEILTTRVDEEGTEHIRTSALPIKFLMDYTDEDGISMYTSRMARVMKLLLKISAGKQKTSIGKSWKNCICSLVSSPPQPEPNLTTSPSNRRAWAGAKRPRREAAASEGGWEDASHPGPSGPRSHREA
ncbi:hypothetical protein PCASD_00640 [Puccinia coronata f. sp. avenae]|uniref:Uncharacterized protein n=1 Tax=Puccinia coronata f. sp. avenae TaxID=200324 RepID=A0A2N5VL82_9BASI|nr:hypothetical protein PCASD_00640 [Puccinia coronata f. sp. avenae]